MLSLQRLKWFSGIFRLLDDLVSLINIDFKRKKMVSGKFRSEASTQVLLQNPSTANLMLRDGQHNKTPQAPKESQVCAGITPSITNVPVDKIQ